MSSNLRSDPKFLGNKNQSKNDIDLKIKNLVSALDGPKPKRSAFTKQQIKSKFKHSKYKENDRANMQFGKGEEDPEQPNKQQAKQKQRKSKNSSYLFSQLSKDEERECENITQILSYFLGQFESSGKSASTKSSIYMDWEINQIARNYEDTNLGDYIIKLPNPDSMPKTLMQINEDDELPTYSFAQTYENYDEMFNTELNIDRNMDQYEKKAFILAFYLLEFQSYYERPKSLKESAYEQRQAEKKKNAQDFIFHLNYYLQICNIGYLDYLGLLKDFQFKNKQRQLCSEAQQQKRKFEEAYKKDTKVEQFEKIFQGYKRKVYEYLDKKLKSNEKGIDIAQDVDIIEIFEQVSSLSLLLNTFPRFFMKLKKEAFNKIIKSKKQIKKKIVGGNYLKKVSSNGELRWVRSDKRPADVYTLLRNILLFRLSRRGGLFIRTFLSEDQHYIFLIIKASQAHLEKMAQKSSFIMEVELGATDIFSFQPVDKYNRPLRTNRYITDPGFIRKYNLRTNKNDKDEGTGDNSAESQAVTFYGKAQKMNEEQLRAKIILDQEECDECYRWLSKITGVRYIHSSETLSNNYNKNEVSNKIWPIYYVYNKMIIDGIKGLRKQLDGTKKGNPRMYKGLMNNLGLILRLIFLKALWVSNDTYRKHRKTFFRGIKNALTDTQILKTIWDKIGNTQPRAYWPYFSSGKLERIWRKHQINEQKFRSKFTPASRVLITNDIVREYLNVSKAMTQKLLIQYFPIHDPFVLKNILLRPYLNVITNLLTDDDGVAHMNSEQASLDITQSLVAYECQKTKQDFTKKSVIEKLGFSCGKLTQFSVNTVCFYCGQKLAFYFEFRRFLAKSAFPFTIITFIIQIMFWVQLNEITVDGTSQLKNINNVLMCILVIINIIWVDRTIHNWQQHEKQLARSFGTASDGKKQQNEQVRILFSGKMKRNMETDQMNDEQASAIPQFLKAALSFFINIVFVVCMGATILIIFALKNQMYQRGYDQQAITIVPSILIAITVQVFNFIYSIIVKLIVDFQNLKTIPEYESSLSSKSFIITFVVSFYALFIYGFFSGYFEGSDVCTIKIQTGQEIYDCYFYMSSQITTSALVEFAVTIVMAFVPLILFKLKLYLSNKQKNQNVTFNLNYFESIDRFYEEQDRMKSYMYNDEIDQTWLGYTKVVVAFCMLILFGPIVPFLYTMIFINGIVSLHAKKYEIIYLSRRGLPIKVGSIGSWITMLKVVSVIGVFTNVGIVVYVRQVFTERASVIYFSVVFVSLALRYVATIVLTSKQDIVGKRSKFKTSELILEKGLSDFSTKADNVNTDIENVYYDENKLNRKLPNLKGANVRKA